MAGKSDIEWTDATWNPVRGCSRVSPGCGGPKHEGGCYAEKIAARFSDPGQPFHGFAARTPHGGRWTGKLALIDDMLTVPLRWKKPRRIFVNSMSDLFHEALPDEAIDKVFVVMALAPQHTFQVLTKRAERMREYCTAFNLEAVARYHAPSITQKLKATWPLPNVWLGVSAERQQEADERIPHLLQTPAAIRFVSAEPLLGPINFSLLFPGTVNKLDWMIVGGESGPGARTFNVEWADSIVAQCKPAGVACFVKQLGAAPMSDGYPLELKDRKGGDWSEWPDRLRIRQFPYAMPEVMG